MSVNYIHSKNVLDLTARKFAKVETNFHNERKIWYCIPGQRSDTLLFIHIVARMRGAYYKTGYWIVNWIY
jgi:hypothetical protein